MKGIKINSKYNAYRALGTCKTDKNGAEIHEGDFLKNVFGRVAIVIWDKDNGQWSTKYVSGVLTAVQ
jgi:hypothetical protein